MSKVKGAIVGGLLALSLATISPNRLVAQAGKPKLENINGYLTQAEKKALGSLEKNLQKAWADAPKRLGLPADAVLRAPVFTATHYTLEEFESREHEHEILSYPHAGSDILFGACSKDSVRLRVLVGERLGAGEVKRLVDFTYLEVLSSERGLEGWGLFNSGSVSLLYSKTGMRTDDNMLVGLLAFACHKQKIDFLAAYLKDDYENVAAAVDGFFHAGAMMEIRRALMKKEGPLGEFERLMKEKAENEPALGTERDPALWDEFASFMRERFGVAAGRAPQ